MRVYWQERTKGQRLVLAAEDGNEIEAGGVRETPRGFDAFATTLGYDPGRAQKGFPTLEEAKAFVESFQPWEMYEGGTGLTVEPEVHTTAEPGPPTAPPNPQAPAPDEADTETQASPGPDADATPAPSTTEMGDPKRWWEIWKRG